MADKSKGSAKCNETSKIEALIQRYEQRNRELEAYEAEVASRLKILEETIPALKIWYMWRIFNAVGQPMQSPENINKLLECENSSPDANNDLVYLMQQLKDFEIKLNKDNSKLKAIKETEMQLRSKITELENNIKIKDISVVDEFAKLQSEKMEFLNKLVKDCKLVSNKIIESEEKEEPKPQGILIQMDPHKSLDGKQKDQLDPFVDSRLPEHLTQLEKEVVELQELINQRVEGKQVESEKGELTYCRNIDEKTEKDEVDSTDDSDLAARLIQLEKEVIDLQTLLYQREEEQKRMEIEEKKLCSHLQKCLDHLLSFKNNIQAPLLKNLQLQKEKLNMLTKELELQKAEREQDNKLHYNELNELRKQIYKSAEDLKRVISGDSKSREDSQQNNHKETQLHQISYNFIYSVQYDTKDENTNVQAEHAEELNLVFPVEELEKESRSSYALLGKPDANLKVYSGQKSTFSQLNVNQSPHPEYPPSNAHILPTKNVPPSKCELSTEHIMSINHAASTEYVMTSDHGTCAEYDPFTECVVSKDHAALTEHVLSSDYAAPTEQEPFTECVVSEDHAAPTEHEPFTECVISKDHAALTEHVLSSDHVAPTEHEPFTECVVSKDHAAPTEHVLSSYHAAPTEHEPFTEHMLCKEYVAPTEQELSIKIRRRAFEVKTEYMNEMFEDDEKSEMHVDGNNKDKSSSLHPEEASARLEQEKQQPVGTKNELVKDNCNIISLRNKCRVKDHMIKSLADHMKGLNMENGWPVNEFYLNISKDPVKTYDFDRTTLIEYIEGNEPSNMAASLMSDPVYSGDNPLQLQVLDKLDSSTVLVSWGPPPANNVSNFEIFVNGELRCRIHSAARNKALLSELYSMEKAVITLCALDNNGELAGKSTLVYNING